MFAELAGLTFTLLLFLSKPWRGILICQRVKEERSECNFLPELWWFEGGNKAKSVLKLGGAERVARGVWRNSWPSGSRSAWAQPCT